MKKPFFKLLICLSIIFGIGFSTTAKAQLFSPGDKVLNLGLGFGVAWGVTYSTVQVPPIAVSFDYGWRDDLGPGIVGLGGYLGYASYAWESSWLGGSYGYKVSSTVIGAIGTYHMDLVDNLDTYGGLLLGFRIVSDKATGTWAGAYSSSVGSGLTGSLFIGAKYYFSDNIGAFAELGYGIAYFTLGASFKL